MKRRGTEFSIGRSVIGAAIGIACFWGSAAAVDITVDWGTITRTPDPRGYGLCAEMGVFSDVSGDNGYMDNMKYMLEGPDGNAMVRFHNWDAMGHWAGSDGGWNAAEVDRTIRNFKDAGFKNLLVNIPTGPGGSYDSPTLNGLTEFTRALVRILNTEGKLGVKYIEITNEHDVSFSASELATAFNAAAKAAKAEDPSIKTGGAAFMQPNEEAYVQSFVNAALPNLDFISYHFYAGCDGITDAQSYDRTVEGAAHGTFFANLIKQVSPNRKIELHDNEYNIGWSWDCAGTLELQNSITGAIFDALMLVNSVDAGCDIMNAWSDKGGSYGKMGDGNGLHPAAHVYHMFNNWMVGPRSKVSTSNDKLVVPCAVTNPKYRSVALINRSGSAQTVKATFTGWTPSNSFTLNRLTGDGNFFVPNAQHVSYSQLTAGSLSLPANSVSILTINEGAVVSTIQPQDARSVGRLAGPQLLNARIGGVSVGIDGRRVDCSAGLGGRSSGVRIVRVQSGGHTNLTRACTLN